jgi:hypothetical protein
LSSANSLSFLIISGATFKHNALILAGILPTAPFGLPGLPCANFGLGMRIPCINYAIFAQKYAMLAIYARCALLGLGSPLSASELPGPGHCNILAWAKQMIEGAEGRI